MSGLGRCGGLVNGVRCGIPLGERDVVCGRCQHLVTELYWRTGEGRRFISSLAVKGAVAARKEQQEAVAAAEEEARRRQDQAEATRAAPHLVYYARLGHNHIKIGTTYDLTRRMAELRVVNESNLLAAEPGGFDVEQQRHEQFGSGATSAERKTSAKDPTCSTTSARCAPRTAHRTNWQPDLWNDQRHSKVPHVRLLSLLPGVSRDCRAFSRSGRDRGGDDASLHRRHVPRREARLLLLPDHREGRRGHREAHRADRVIRPGPTRTHLG